MRQDLIDQTAAKCKYLSKLMCKKKSKSASKRRWGTHGAVSDENGLLTSGMTAFADLISSLRDSNIQLWSTGKYNWVIWNAESWSTVSLIFYKYVDIVLCFALHSTDNATHGFRTFISINTSVHGYHSPIEDSGTPLTSCMDKKKKKSKWGRGREVVSLFVDGLSVDCPLFQFVGVELERLLQKKKEREVGMKPKMTLGCRFGLCERSAPSWVRLNSLHSPNSLSRFIFKSPLIHKEGIWRDRASIHVTSTHRESLLSVN